MRLVPFALVGAMGALPLVAIAVHSADVLDASRAQKMATDPAAVRAALQQGTAEDVAWDWFVALNSPLTGAAPKLWESWRQTSTVYLPNGHAPAPWGQTPSPPQAVIARAQQMRLDTNLPFHNLDSDVQVDGLALRDNIDPKIRPVRANLRYQLLMNQDTFQYIVSNGIYNVNGQEAMAKASKAADFPATSFELKTSWIWIGDNQAVFNQLNGKYYIVNAYYERVDGSGKPNGLYEVGRAALSGMHIISKPVPQWVWTTFQNVYDDQYTQATNKLPLSPAVRQANQKYQAALKNAGSIFANYQLIGAQWQFEAGGKPVLLANSQIESAFQLTSSCATCHSTASYSAADGYFNLVKQQDGGIVYYTGNPPTDRLKGYNSLDFVWSLKRAHWQR